MSAIQTYTNKYFDLYDIKNESINIEDIAHALSMICRYGGHCNEFYSVAEHSVRMSNEVAPEFALYALLHDGAEAYLGDIPSPFKRFYRIEDYSSYVTCLHCDKPLVDPKTTRFDDVENVIISCIMSKHDLEMPIPREVHIADKRMLFTEIRDLMKSPSSLDIENVMLPYEEKIIPWSPKTAELLFLDRYKELYNVKSNASSN